MAHFNKGTRVRFTHLNKTRKGKIDRLIPDIETTYVRVIADRVHGWETQADLTYIVDIQELCRISND